MECSRTACKEEEIIEVMIRKKINIAVLPETKKKLRGTSDIRDMVMLWTGVAQTRHASSGVAILIDKNGKDISEAIDLSMIE